MTKKDRWPRAQIKALRSRSPWWTRFSLKHALHRTPRRSGIYRTSVAHDQHHAYLLFFFAAFTVVSFTTVVKYLLIPIIAPISEIQYEGVSDSCGTQHLCRPAPRFVCSTPQSPRPPPCYTLNCFSTAAWFCRPKSKLRTAMSSFGSNVDDKASAQASVSGGSTHRSTMLHSFSEFHSSRRHSQC